MRAPFCAMVLLGMALSTPVSAEDESADPLSRQPAVSMNELDATRGLGGGAGFLQMNDMDLDANMAGNVIHSATSGNNAISHGAFSESSGFATVIQNSGNHVIIQNATIVNLKLGE